MRNIGVALGRLHKREYGITAQRAFWGLFWAASPPKNNTQRLLLLIPN
jgi:hypothetical protein